MVAAYLVFKGIKKPQYSLDFNIFLDRCHSQMLVIGKKKDIAALSQGQCEKIGYGSLSITLTQLLNKADFLRSGGFDFYA